MIIYKEAADQWACCCQWPTAGTVTTPVLLLSQASNQQMSPSMIEESFSPNKQHTVQDQQHLHLAYSITVTLRIQI